VVRHVWETAERYEVLRRRLATEWSAGPDRWSDDARVVFDELGLVEGASWRSLLESEAFRVLLEEEPLARAA
jgi:hypothetical protein